MAKYFAFSNCQCSRTQCFHGVPMTATVSPQSGSTYSDKELRNFECGVSKRTF